MTGEETAFRAVHVSQFCHMTEPWRIRLLGGLVASRGGETITRFRTQKTGGLLAYLAFYPGRIHPRESLMEVLWPESDLDAARNSLSVALNSLRRQLEPPATPGTTPVGVVLIADRNTIRLNPDAFTTDVAAFEAALGEARRKETPSEALDALTRADQIYAGELLPGFYEDWALAERERLADAHRQVLRRLTALLMEARDFDRAMGYAHRAVEADPLNEASRHLLMRLYAGIGRTAAVQEQLKEWERLLAAAGEAPPSPATRALALRLAEGTDKEFGGSPIPLSPASAAAKPDQKVVPAPDIAPTPKPSETGGYLPARYTRFFGRDAEITGITDLLRSGDARLVTLTGPGGTGKTRLAVESAARLMPEGVFPGGIWFVPLADVNAPERFFDAVRDALGLERIPSADALSQVTEHFHARQASCLLLLDNLEHLLGRGTLDPDGGAQAASTLLARIPGLHLLATSREPLGIAEEREVAVPPLPVPSDPHQSPETLTTYASVALFVDRARARRVDFQITPRNADAVARLCARLEGSPLAIELAAARAKMYTPSQMLERLNEGFALLETSRPDVPARHRSLRAAAAWSVELLLPPVRQLFARLSVFRGGCTVEAAEAVCADKDAVMAFPEAEGQTLDGLTRLRDASLLIAEEISVGGGEEMRLRLPEPLREFAAELIPESEREGLARRHAAYFLALSETAKNATRGPEQNRWFDRMEADHDNIRAALTRTVDTDLGLRLCGALAHFWVIRGHLVEGTDWLNRALSASRERGDGPSVATARALNAAGMLAYDRADYEAAKAFYGESLDVQRVLGDRTGIAVAVNNLGNVAYRQGDMATARARYTETLAIYREENYRWGIASTLGNLANVVQIEGDLATAHALQEESLALSREFGDTRMTAYTLHNLGNLAQEEGDFARANEFYAESLELKRSLGDRRGVASLLISRAFLALQEEDYEAAYSRFVQAVLLAREVGAWLYVITALDGLGWHASAVGQPLVAARLWGASASARQARGVPRAAGDEAMLSSRVAAARQAATASAFDAAWHEGERLSLEAAAALALREPVRP
jgi:predicted ATPase/DNA-binding SARP family transcriptional activator